MQDISDVGMWRMVSRGLSMQTVIEGRSPVGKPLAYLGCKGSAPVTGRLNKDERRSRGGGRRRCGTVQGLRGASRKPKKLAGVSNANDTEDGA